VRTAGNVRQKDDVVQREEHCRDVRLVLEYVECGAAQTLADQRIDERLLINDGSAPTSEGS